MKQQMDVRPAQDADAIQISGLVQHTIRTSNARDYSPAVIERVANNFSAEAVLGFIRRRTVLVACHEGEIVGTASLDGEMVRTVFVAPEMQGQGIGRQLVGAIETLARRAGAVMLRVQASLTARPFYSRLGYDEVEEMMHGEERTVVMEKRLG